MKTKKIDKNKRDNKFKEELQKKSETLKNCIEKKLRKFKLELKNRSLSK